MDLYASSEKPSVGSRLISMFLDHVFMTIVAMIFFIPSIVSMVASSMNESHDPVDANAFRFLPFALIGFGLYFCKDCFRGRSLAKRITKLQVVDHSTGQEASPLRCLVRNLFIMFWLIEVVVTLFSPGRRLGDFVAGTRVVNYRPNMEKPPLRTGQLLLALGIGIGLMMLLAIPLSNASNVIESSRVELVKSSYNEAASRNIERLYADSLGQYVRADVRVYDQVRNSNKKYVSVILRLKENYMDDPSSFDDLKSISQDMLYSRLGDTPMVGQIKYIYRTETSFTVQTVPFDR
jgi:uncharacterized RDD family membrane protein YckC